MTELEPELIGCFRAVFPQLGDDEIRTARAETVDGWDSLQTVILVAVLEEQFGLRIAAEEFARLRSFASARDYVFEKASPSG